MSETLEELLDENARLRRELVRLERRIRAIEASRWLRLHPRLVWRRGVRWVKRGTDAGARSPTDVAQAADADREHQYVARFRAAVLPRGTFTQTWFLGDAPRWEPILDQLQASRAALLEIGSYEGLSACYLLWRLPEATITCIDTFEGGVEHRGADVDVSELESRFDANVTLVDGSRVRKLVGDSREKLLDLASERARFDLVYVDGSHLALDVIVDAALSWQLLEPGGTLVFDDYGWAELGEDKLLRPGPAVDAFLDLVDGKYELRFHEYQVAIRKAS
jgi:hypothetical protein